MGAISQAARAEWDSLERIHQGVRLCVRWGGWHAGQSWIDKESFHWVKAETGNDAGHRSVWLISRFAMDMRFRCYGAAAVRESESIPKALCSRLLDYLRLMDLR